MESRTILFYGTSGSGKGTQIDLLKVYLKERDPEHEVLHIETGAKFREFMKGETHTQRLVKKAIEEGGLLPGFFPIWVWGGILTDTFEGKEHLLLDGLARREAEASILDGALKFYGRNNPDVVVLNVSRVCAFDRLKKRGRHDDNDEKINRRLDWYDEHVIPAISYFRGKPEYNLYDIDGERSIGEIHKDILGQLKW